MVTELARVEGVDKRLRFAQIFALLFSLSWVYLATMPQAITLEDAGIFQMVCHLGGISHPPGYPLFTALCQLATFGDSTLTGNLMSMYFALAAVLFFYLVVVEMTDDHFLAVMAAGAYGFSSCFWSQAIIIEVYTFAAALFFCCWWLLLKFVRTHKRVYWYNLCLFAGLAISNHWPLFVLSCIGFISLLYCHSKVFLHLINLKTFAFSLVLFVLGLSPYLLLFQADPAIAMYGELGLRNFLPYFLRDYYSDNHLGARWSDKVQYLQWMLPLSAMQLGWIGAPLVLLGLIYAKSMLRVEDLICTVGVFMASTFLLVLLLNFRFEFQTRAVFAPYPIIAMSAVALFSSIGLVKVLRWLNRVNSRLSYLVGFTIALSLVFYNYPRVDRSKSNIADQYARVVLSSLPQNAVLFVGGDNQIGPIGFYSKVKNLRPDVSVYSKDGLVFREKIVPLYSSIEERLDAISSFANTSGRRIFTTDRLTPHDIDYGLYHEFRTKEQIASTGRTIETEVLLPDIELFSDYLINLDANRLVHDGHERVFLHSLLVAISRQHSQLALRVGTQNMGKLRGQRLARLQKTLPGKLSGLRTLLIDRPNADGLLDYGLELEEQLDRSVANQHDALAYEFIGRIYASRNNREQAIAYYRKSIAKYPTNENASLCELSKIIEQPSFDQMLTQFSLKLENCAET